jgi:RNA recognition motif-containing protein
VETIKIVRDKKTRICKGYAFLEMKDRIGAENAVIALDGTPIADRVLSVKINDDFVKKSPPPRKSFGYGNNNRNNSGNRPNDTRSYNSQSNYRSNDEQSPAGDRPRRPRKTM